jgi:hypothetical protein
MLRVLLVEEQYFLTSFAASARTIKSEIIREPSRCNSHLTIRRTTIDSLENDVACGSIIRYAR